MNKNNNEGNYLRGFLIALAFCIPIWAAIWFVAIQAIPDHYESAGQRQEAHQG